MGIALNRIHDQKQDEPNDPKDNPSQTPGKCPARDFTEDDIHSHLGRLAQEGTFSCRFGGARFDETIH